MIFHRAALGKKLLDLRGLFEVAYNCCNMGTLKIYEEYFSRLALGHYLLFHVKLFETRGHLTKVNVEAKHARSSPRSRKHTRDIWKSNSCHRIFTAVLVTCEKECHIEKKKHCISSGSIESKLDHTYLRLFHL